MTKNIFIGALVVIALGLGVLLFAVNGGSGLLSAAGTGMNHYQPENFLQGLYAGTLGQFSVNKTGSTTVSSLTIGTGGTPTTKILCATTTWNPGSVASSGNPTILSATSTSFNVSGSVVGDTCSASLSSATSTSFDVGCNVPSNGSGTVFLYNDGAAAIDPATGTAKFCYSH